MDKVRKWKRVELTHELVGSGEVTLITCWRDTNEVSSARHITDRREVENIDIKHKKQIKRIKKYGLNSCNCWDRKKEEQQNILKKNVSGNSNMTIRKRAAC